MAEFDISKYTGKTSEDASGGFDISKYTDSPKSQYQVTGDPLVDERIRSGLVAGQGKRTAPTRAPSDISEQVLGPAKKSISEGLAERGLSGLGKTGMGALEYAFNLPAALTAQYAPTFLVTQGGRMPEDVARRKLAADLSMMQQVALPELTEVGPSSLVSREIKASQVPIVTDKPAALKAIQKDVGAATSKSDVGGKIAQNLESRYNDLKAAREKQFEPAKTAYFNAGQKQGPQILEDYKNFLQQEYAKAASTGSKDEIGLIEKLANRVSDRKIRELFDVSRKEGEIVTPQFDVIEKERRFLNDVANGLKPEGSEGIQAGFARQMADDLEKIIANRVPKEFENFKKTYRDLSAAINEYARGTGADVIKRADEYLPDVSKLDPARLPDKFFKSRRSIQDLRALSADETFVQQIAKEHIATELRNAKTAEEIRKYLADNYDWMQEFPQMQKDLEQIASTQRGKEIRKSLLKWGAGLTAVSYGSGAISSGLGKLYGILTGD